jgi:hypothetical protein
MAEEIAEKERLSGMIKITTGKGAKPPEAY